MMKSEQRQGRGKLLEAWETPASAGEAIGCLTTTFTFDAPFFEEQCLSRFLGMETDPKEHGAAYLIEREERLAQVYAGVIVDRRYAGLGKRSLRWDVLPVRVPGAVMHAKITLLMWGNCIRLIVGSANLTEVAYRKNLEVYGILDFQKEGGLDREEIYKTVAFIGDLLDFVGDGPASERAVEFLKSVKKRIQSWNNYRRKRSEIQARVLFGGRSNSKRLSVIEDLREDIWNSTGPPRWACVVSPFYDPDSNAAGLALREILAQRGDRSIAWDVVCQKEPAGRLRISAPKWLSDILPDSCFRPLRLEDNEEARPLHAKCLWLENEEKIVYMVGSSNFTSAGLGVGKGPWNIEANIAYIASSGGKALKALDLAYPASDDEVTNLNKVIWNPAMDRDAMSLGELYALPAGFIDALFVSLGNEKKIIVKLAEALPTRWWLFNKEEKVYDRAQWISQQCPDSIELVWTCSETPSALLVKWLDKHGDKREAFWAVNVDNCSSLPLPEDLRNLSLDTLLDVLTMSRPLYETIMRTKIMRKKKEIQGKTNPELDPLKRIQTSTFLLQRTKRMALALEQLQERLGKPIPTREALDWRLRGPVGPLALVKSLQRESRPHGETAFLLAEIALTLGRVSVFKTQGALSSRIVNTGIRNTIKEIKKIATKYLKESPKDISRYVKSAFKEVIR